jgi:predicted DNA-binding transcriptional regulator AlpA
MPDRIAELIDRIDQLLRHIETARADRIIRPADLPAYAGLKRTQIQVLIGQNEFPKPIALSDTGRALGFLEGEIRCWQLERIAKRDAKQ